MLRVHDQGATHFLHLFGAKRGKSLWRKGVVICFYT